MREYFEVLHRRPVGLIPIEPARLDVDNPTTEVVSGKIALGTAADVDRAVKAARKAFGTWSQTTREERLDVPLQAIGRPSTRNAPGDPPTRVNEMGAPARRWRRARRSVSGWDTWPPRWTC